MQTLARDFMLAVLSNQAHIAIYNREEKHLSPADNDAINAMRREFERKFCALLNEGVAAGEFSVDDVQLASLAIGGIVSWSYVWYRPKGRLSPAGRPTAWPIWSWRWCSRRGAGAAAPAPKLPEVCAACNSSQSRSQGRSMIAACGRAWLQ